ncbi:hypothetical protein [Streptomyces sp. NBC_01244]|uniref:hypothetical protein n=1 Tax=Streptomyces sp. NBC_01244 TaxID=2903797 RepID=UPI002E0DD9D1|nr:hypothetical protein OG247_44040 [Streptomyces sp. NBC_01244]
MNSAATPSACRWCGIPARDHFQQWKPPVGWHKYALPTTEQIKARMRERRRARSPKPPAHAS